MKKRIQKYLSGNNEGFSLVELIIVIAIMAILVGVVALAVIPNIERSRESKDLTTLDNIASGVSAAVANAGSAASSGSFNAADIKSGSSDAVISAAFEQLGDMSATKLNAACASGKTASDIAITYDTTSNKISVSVAGVTCKYQKDDAGNARTYEVSK